MLVYQKPLVLSGRLKWTTSKSSPSPEVPEKTSGPTEGISTASWPHSPASSMPLPSMSPYCAYYSSNKNAVELLAATLPCAQPRKHLAGSILWQSDLHWPLDGAFSPKPAVTFAFPYHASHSTCLKGRRFWSHSSRKWSLAGNFVPECSLYNSQFYILLNIYKMGGGREQWETSFLPHPPPWTLQSKIPSVLLERRHLVTFVWSNSDT